VKVDALDSLPDQAALERLYVEDNVGQFRQPVPWRVFYVPGGPGRANCGSEGIVLIICAAQLCC
jgi:hypothetical protein